MFLPLRLGYFLIFVVIVESTMLHRTKRHWDSNYGGYSLHNHFGSWPFVPPLPWSYSRIYYTSPCIFPRLCSKIKSFYSNDQNLSPPHSNSYSQNFPTNPNNQKGLPPTNFNNQHPPPPPNYIGQHPQLSANLGNQNYSPPDLNNQNHSPLTNCDNHPVPPTSCDNQPSLPPTNGNNGSPDAGSPDYPHSANENAEIGGSTAFEVQPQINQQPPQIDSAKRGDDQSNFEDSESYVEAAYDADENSRKP